MLPWDAISKDTSGESVYSDGRVSQEVLNKASRPILSALAFASLFDPYWACKALSFLNPVSLQHLSYKFLMTSKVYLVFLSEPCIVESMCGGLNEYFANHFKLRVQSSV